jgi:Flp pilus assembly protein CpaB
MNRRRRAFGFLLLALLAAAGAATLADRYGASAIRGYGPLRPVVVLGGEIAAGRMIGARETSMLTVRRVPVRFTPPDALATPAEALGQVTRTRLSAGSYLLAAQLGAPRDKKKRGTGLAGNRRPVEILVSGADSLLEVDPDPSGSRVDIVVTSEPTGPGPGRTYVAASQVPLLSLRPGPEGPGPGANSAATLGLTRNQALRLIAAESFARQVTLLPGG